MESGNVFISSLIVLIVPSLRNFFFATNKHGEIVQEKKKGRIPFFDVVKGVAIIAVVLIHVVGVMEEFSFFSHTLIPYFLNALFRFAIPVFIIASGSLLTIKDYHWKSLISFFCTKCVRIIIPYLFMVALIVYWNGESFRVFIHHAISGDILVPYYFVVILIQLYVLFPVLYRYRTSRWLLPISFAISLVMFLYPPFWNIGGIPFCGEYLFFFVYGITKGTSFIDSEKFVKQTSYLDIRVLLFLCGLYFTLFFLLPDYYYNIQFVYGVVIYNLCVYGYMFFRGNHVLRWLEKLGGMSLWIFLVHYPLVIWSISLISLFMAQSSLVFLLSGLLSLTLSVSLGLLFRELYSRILSLVQMKNGNGVIFENHYPMGQV